MRKEPGASKDFVTLKPSCTRYAHSAEVYIENNGK